MYERPADDLRFIWVPRTTFAVNRQLHFEARQCLLKRHVFIRISMRLKPEFRAWLLEGTHTKGWLIQTSDAGSVTEFKSYHMHIEIGPKNKLPLTSILLSGREALVNFCARFVTWPPKPRDRRSFTLVAVPVYNMVPRRLRLRITSLQPLEHHITTRTEEHILYESLLSMWWSFEDVQITSVADKDSAIRTRKLLSGDKWHHCEDYLEFTYARDVLTVLAIANNQLQVAVQLSRRQQLLSRVMSMSVEFDTWMKNAVDATKLHTSYLRHLMLDFELQTRLAQASESENDLADCLKQAYIAHGNLSYVIDAGLAPDMDSQIHINYLLSICYRFGGKYAEAKEYIDTALEECPDDKRLHRERVILNILTNRNFSDQQLREKASEFRKYPVELRKTDIEFASTARTWKIPLTASLEEQQDVIMQYVRFRKKRLYSLFS